MYKKLHQEEYPLKYSDYNDDTFISSSSLDYKSINGNDRINIKLPASFNRLDRQGIFANRKLCVSDINRVNECPFEGCCVHSYHSDNEMNTIEKSIRSKKNVVFNNNKSSVLRRCVCPICSRNDYVHDYKYRMEDGLDDAQSETSTEINGSGFAFEDDLFKEDTKCNCFPLYGEKSNREISPEPHRVPHSSQAKKSICSNVGSLCRYCGYENGYSPSNERNGYKPNFRDDALCKPYESTSVFNRSSSFVGYPKFQKSEKYGLCEFCLKNGQSTVICSSHQLKDDYGAITCPILKHFAAFPRPQFENIEYVSKNDFGKVTSEPCNLHDLPLHISNSMEKPYSPKLSPGRESSTTKTKNCVDNCDDSDILNNKTRHFKNPSCSCSNWFPFTKEQTCKYCLSVGLPKLSSTDENLTYRLSKKCVEDVDYGICNSCGHSVHFPIVPVRKHVCSLGVDFDV